MLTDIKCSNQNPCGFKQGSGASRCNCTNPCGFQVEVPFTGVTEQAIERESKKILFKYLKKFSKEFLFDLSEMHYSSIKNIEEVHHNAKG
jgi:hypothetical protein